MSLIEALQFPDKRRQVLMQLKEQNDFDQFHQALEDNEKMLLSLLDDEDSKVRKIAFALFCQDPNPLYRDILLAHYFNEKQRMIRASMIKSLGQYDLSDEMARLEELEAHLIEELNSDMSKHAKEELRALRNVLKPYRTLPVHHFTGLNRPVSMILAVPAGHQAALMDELVWLETKKVNMGVQVITDQLDRLYENRLFSHIYFPLCKVPSIQVEDVVSEKVIHKILRFLDDVHEGDFAYRFRIAMEDHTQSRQIAETLEANSHGRLQNQPYDYEIEIRIRTNKQQEGVIYLRLMTILDPRFTYRQKITSTSLNSQTAALIVHYLQDYIQTNGRVIDPLCHDATLLIERCQFDHPYLVMGLNMSHEVMEMAKYNADQAGVDIRFVERDIRTFQHQKRFDELLTQLPSIVSEDQKETVEQLYRRVFKLMPTLLEAHGIAAIYSAESSLMKQCYQKSRRNIYLKQKIPMIGNYLLYIFEVSQVQDNL